MRVEITPRERLVFTMIGQGHGREAIAEEIGCARSGIDRLMRDLHKATKVEGTIPLLIHLLNEGQLPELEPKREMPDLQPETPTQHAVWTRLVVSSYNWRDFRDMRQAYETVKRQGL